MSDGSDHRRSGEGNTSTIEVGDGSVGSATTRVLDSQVAGESTGDSATRCVRVSQEGQVVGIEGGRGGGPADTIRVTLTAALSAALAVSWKVTVAV